MAINALELVNAVLTQTDFQQELSTIQEDIMGAKALLWVNQAIETLFNACQDWSWRETLATVSLTSGNEAATLPANCDPNTIKTVLRGSDNLPLEYLDYWEWQQYKYDRSLEGNTTAAGDPLIYTVVAQQILVWPLPGTGKTIKFYYQKEPDVLAADTDATSIPSNYHFSVLVPLALTFAKGYLGDDDVKNQSQMASTGIKNMLANNRRYFNRTSGMKISEPNRITYEGR